MKQQPDLASFSFAWRGALGGLIGPVGLVMFLVFSDPNPGVIIYFFPVALVAAVGGGSVGAVSGFIIGLLYTDGMRVGFAVRLAISLGISLLLPLVFVILFYGPNAYGWVKFTILMTLMMGLMPAIMTTPLGLLRSRKSEGSMRSAKATAKPDETEAAQ